MVVPEQWLSDRISIVRVGTSFPVALEVSVSFYYYYWSVTFILTISHVHDLNYSVL